MAQLTDRLPLTDPSTKVYDIPAAPRTLGAVAGFATDLLNGYMKVRQDESERKRSEAAARDKAQQKASSYAAIKGYNEAVDLSNNSGTAAQPTAVPEVPPAVANQDASFVDNVSTFQPTAAKVFQPNTLDPGISKAIQSAGSQVQNISLAVDQGKMPSISLKAALNGKFNQLIDRFPDQAENVLDIWKKMGIDTTLFREGRDLGDQLDENREAGQRQTEDERKFQEQMFELGAQAAGETMATGGANGGPMSREEVISHGLVVSRQAHDLKMQLDAVNIQTQEAGLSRTKKEDLEKDKNHIIFQSLNNAFYNGNNPVVNMVQNLADSIMKEPNPAKQAERWQTMGTRLHSMTESQIDHAVQLAFAGGYTGDESTLRTSLTNQFKRVEDLFTGDFSVAQAHLAALQTIQTKLKLDGGTALPVYTALKDLGMDPTTMTGFINGIGQNTALTEQLRNEIKGFSTDFGKDRASEHLMQIVHMLRGESTLAYMSPSEARNKMPELYNATNSIATNYARGLGGDPEMVMNGLGELSIAANSLTPSSGAAAHAIAVSGVLGNSQVTALKKLTTEKGIDQTMATATIQAARAAGAHELNNFQANVGKLNNESDYFKIKWDVGAGRYLIDNSLQRKAIAANRNSVSAGTLAAGQGFIRGNPTVNVPSAPPKEMEQWVRGSNVALDGIIALRDNDPSTPKGTDLELRQYYGRNKPTPSMLKTDTPIDVNAAIEKQFSAIEHTIDSSLTAANTSVSPDGGTVKGVDTSKSFEANVPAIMKAEGTAQAKGWDTILGDTSKGGNSLGVTPPKPVTQMTMNEVLDFAKNTLLPASGSMNSSAVGGLQITSTNIARFAPQVFGSDWENHIFDKDAQIALAKAIHAEQGYGAWEGLKK